MSNSKEQSDFRGSSGEPEDAATRKERAYEIGISAWMVRNKLSWASECCRITKLQNMQWEAACKEWRRKEVWKRAWGSVREEAGGESGGRSEGGSGGESGGRLETFGLSDSLVNYM